MKNTEIFVVLNDFTAITTIYDADLYSISKGLLLYYSAEYDFYFTDKIKVYELVKNKYKNLFIFTNNLDVENRYRDDYPIKYIPLYVFPERYLNQRTYGIGLTNSDEFTFIQRTIYSYYEYNEKVFKEFIDSLKSSNLVKSFSFGTILYDNRGKAIDFTQVKKDSKFEYMSPDTNNLLSYILNEFPDVILYSHLVRITKNNLYISLNIDNLNGLKHMSLIEDWPFSNGVYIEDPTLWFYKPLLMQNQLSMTWFIDNKFLTLLNEYDNIVQYKIHIPPIFLLDQIKNTFEGSI
jgi:hypothetical protein